MRRLLLSCVLALSGCVSGLAQRQAFLNQFVGRPEHELIQVLGVPDRTYQVDEVKYVGYQEQQVEILPSPPFGPWWHYRWSGMFGPEIINLTCETTFVVRDGVVKSYTLRGNACG